MAPVLASGSSAPNENATRAVPSCSLSSNPTAASAWQPDSDKFASAADHIGAGQAARPSSAIATRTARSLPSLKSQPSAATPCPTSLLQIAEMASGEDDCFAATSAFQ